MMEPAVNIDEKLLDSNVQFDDDSNNKSINDTYTKTVTHLYATNTATIGSNPSPRRYPIKLSGCLDYVDAKTGTNLFYPYFRPMALVGTCCIVGRIESKLDHEVPLCCEMGPKGLFCCVISTPITLLSPIGGGCYYTLLAGTYRYRLEKRYKFTDNDPCCTCFGPYNPYCEAMHNACNYPCAFYQIYTALRDVEYISRVVSIINVKGQNTPGKQ